MVAQGRFRQDLFYRINVMHIEAPSLQDRPEDIPMLAEHFLTRYSETYEKPMRGFEPEALMILLAHPWPGNVRELENVVQRAIILSSDSMIRPEDLPDSMRDQDVVSIDSYHASESFEGQLRDYKVKLALAAVRDNNGNKTMAARSLRISRAYLHRLIRNDDQPFSNDTDCRALETA